MSDNELLLALSELIENKLDAKLEPLQADIRDIKLTIENELFPKIQLLAENYVPAALRYERNSSKIKSLESDVDLLKKVVTEHSKALQDIS